MTWTRDLVRLLFGLSAVWLTASAAWSDTVVMMDRRELVGTVTLVTPEIVQMKTPENQLNILKRADVALIRFEPGRTPVNPLPLTSGKPPVKPEVPKQPPVNVIAQFPSDGAPMDKDRFNMLAVFEGKATRSPYVGLYHFGDKGTFWVQLAEPLPIQSQMRFTVYGKRNKNQPIEPFRLKARFLDKLGNEIASTPMVDYGTRVPGEGEWFKYLDGVAGLAGPLPVQWNVPKGTKVIEFQAYAESDTRRHLVGYLGQLVLFQDLLAGELPPISRER